MNKAKLTRFIQKYSLGGLVESVTWKTEDNKLVTRFISDDKTVLGEIQLDNFAFTSPDLGVYTTSTLSKLLSVVGLFNFLNFFQNKASFWAIAGLLYINKFDLFVDIDSKDVMKYTLDTELVLT